MILLLLAGAPGASGQVPHLAGALDLSSAGGLRIDGAAPNDKTGRPIAPVGDVNGDGRTDFAVGAGRGLERLDQPIPDGSLYIVFGGPTQGEIDLASLGTAGFRIALPSAITGQYSAAAAGDVNGDGLGDVVLAHDSYPAEDNSGGEGRAFVVFGKRDSDTVDVRALGGHGFAIRASQQYQGIGQTVGGVGDVNGDGLADLVVGAPSTRPRGSAFVVFGKRDSAELRVGELEGHGYEIAGAGWDASPAGDVNGDGIGDVIVGAPSEGPAGAAYVVFGKADSSPVDVHTAPGVIRILGAHGDRPIPGGGRISIAPGDGAGNDVAGVGDVNGDGLTDVAVVAPNALVRERDLSVIGSLLAPRPVPQGILYVVFGRRTAGDVSLAALGDQGFRIVPGENAAGRYPQAAGDLNGDGLADLLLLSTSQFGYAVFGKRDSGDLSLDGLGDHGFYVRLPDRTGVAGTGDFDADGRTDLLLGFPDADALGRAQAGFALFTHLGFPPPLASGDCANQSLGTGVADALPGTTAGDLSGGFAADDFLGGLDGNDCLDGGSGDDILSGGAGNDRLVGGPDVDVLSGGDGNDVLIGNRGRDSFDGGAGDDTIDAADGAVEVVDCGAGNDSTRVDRFDHPRGCEHVTRVRLAATCVQPRLKAAPAPHKKGRAGLRLTVFDPDSRVPSMVVDWGDGAKAAFAPPPRGTKRGRPGTRVVRRGLARGRRFTATAVALASQPKGCGAHTDVSRVARVRVVG